MSQATSTVPDWGADHNMQGGEAAGVHTSGDADAVAPRPSPLAPRPLLWLAAALLIFVAAVTYRTALNIFAGAGEQVEARTPAVIDPVTRWQTRLAQRPEDADAYAQLGLALLQQVRDGNDTSLYARAGQAFDAALARDPQQLDALVGRGMLALALHDFAGALARADQVLAASPYKAAGLGIRVDALVELGRYDEAVQALQQMVNLRPDLESYSRVSYLRELHGDVEGAIQAMAMAAETAVPGSEPWRWTVTHLGHLYWNQGKLDQAEAHYREVLRRQADDPFAQAGLARVAGARGNLNQAVDILRPLAARLPLPEFLVALGEAYAAAGRPQEAQAQYDLVEVIQQLNAAAGMNVDLELAAFDVQHGADAQAALAAAEAAYAARPTIYAAGTLAWALHRVGRNAEAWEYSQESLRLGTRDAQLHHQAGQIARALGDETRARTHLEAAQAINPHFAVGVACCVLRVP